MRHAVNSINGVDKAPRRCRLCGTGGLLNLQSNKTCGLSGLVSILLTEGSNLDSRC